MGRRKRERGPDAAGQGQSFSRAKNLERTHACTHACARTHALAGPHSRTHAYTHARAHARPHARTHTRYAMNRTVRVRVLLRFPGDFKAYTVRRRPLLASLTSPDLPQALAEVCQPQDVDLRQCGTVKSADDITNRPFSFTVQVPERNFFFIAESDNDRNEWVAAIGRATTESRRVRSYSEEVEYQEQQALIAKRKAAQARQQQQEEETETRSGGARYS